MFNNIGQKIKVLAQIVCWIGIAGSVLYALFILTLGFVAILINEQAAQGFILIILAPVVGIVGAFLSWVSVWTLYAFGELVDKTEENERNTAQILKLLEIKKTVKTNPNPNLTYQNHNLQAPSSPHKWMCEHCKNMRSQTPCEYCGNE